LKEDLGSPALLFPKTALAKDAFAEDVKMLSLKTLRSALAKDDLFDDVKKRFPLSSFTETLC
jgi:hypothetical protein